MLFFNRISFYLYQFANRGNARFNKQSGLLIAHTLDHRERVVRIVNTLSSIADAPLLVVARQLLDLRDRAVDQLLSVLN